MRLRLGLVLSAGLLAGAAAPAADTSSLLFLASADRSTTADVAAGDKEPNFQSSVTVVSDGRRGGALHVPDDGYVTWKAPGNMYAQRGTLAFFWRAQAPLGVAPFVIFRAGFADHSSWDMCFLRVDWNGHGFDAFVTDANLARVRVSFKIPEVPAAAAWLHLAFGWDETQGVRLYVDGREVARVDTRADLDAGLDQFGFAGRIIAPHQVQSRYSFMRGSDADDLRVYDHLLAAAEIASLAAADAAPSSSSAPASTTTLDRAAWLHRFGWDRRSPPHLDAVSTRVRKIEFSDARDLKQWMFKGVDGIDETTWPGVYNRSRLPGRNDYFTLPDWNTYVEGGQRYVLTVPPGERVNRVEIRGAADGTLEYAADGAHFDALVSRAAGIVRSSDDFAARTGGTLRFTNTTQETPIQELWAYDIAPGEAPPGSLALTYTVQSGVDARSYAALDRLNDWIAGRFPASERTTVVAIPAGAGAPRAAAAAGNAADGAAADRRGSAAPLVHVLIPSTFAPAPAARPVARAWNYGWENVHDGLDGIAIDLPALNLPPQSDGLIPLAIRVDDPIWPGRHLIDVSVSVRPGEKRTLWLDTRDRFLTNDSLALSIASASALTAESLDGMAVRLIFTPRAAALREHTADRFNQVRDNWGFLVEEHTSSQRAGLYRRVYADISDLLRVDPEHVEGRRYWADINYGAPGWPAFAQPIPPAGVPLWAFRQLEDLKRVRQFVDWWIEHRQVPYGDFGGGISDDTDLLQQWPGLALMGVEPDRINASLRALSDAVYKNGMMTEGLATIVTDELHAYEEGINSNAERLYLNWGEPIAVERLMSTVAALTRVLLVNPAGHMHFASNWYGAGRIYREGPWEWQKPYSFTVMHAPMLVGLYNGNPTARGLITGTVDGLMAHGKQDASGEWTFPNEINWRTDAERVGDGAGVISPAQSAWAAWRFTGNDKYLRPVLARVARGGFGTLGEFNENLLAQLNRADWHAAAAREGKSGGEFARYAAWNETNDPTWLEALHADAIADKTQRMFMNTEGHPWSDRAEQVQSDILQRERLGGAALRRNQTWPGHTVSWRFGENGAAEQVALLLPSATPSRFTVTAFNTSDHPQRATMTAWNVTAGRWRATSSDGSSRELTLERSASTELAFPPRAESHFEFTLLEAGTPVESRPDLGIGVDDVRVENGGLSVTVHSLGARPTGAGEVVAESADGRILARARVPALDAPLDLKPRTARVRLNLPAGTATAGLIVRVSLASKAAELTLMNNTVTVTVP